jgi:hypothetical protein
MEQVSMYLVIAFRWGYTNNSWYIVYGGPDRTKACAMATMEANHSGGKYGCVAYEFNADGTEYKAIHYESSSYGETEPQHNERIEYFERLGHFTHDYASGKVLLPDPFNPGRMKYTDVEAPQVVKDEVERQRKILEGWQRAMASHKARLNADSATEQRNDT